MQTNALHCETSTTSQHLLSKASERISTILRWGILLSLVFFKFSNTLSLLIPVIGVLCYLTPCWRQYYRTHLPKSIAYSTLFFVIIVFLQTFNVPIPTHAMHKSLLHYLIYIPLPAIGCLFMQPKHRRYLLNALLIAVCWFSVLYALQMIAAHIHWQQTTLWSIWQQHPTLLALYNLITTNHIQDNGILLGIGFMLSANRLYHAYRASAQARIFAYASLSLLFMITALLQPERVGLLCLCAAGLYLGFIHFKIKGMLISLVILVGIIATLYLTPAINVQQAQVQQKITDMWHGPLQHNHAESTQMRLDGIHRARLNIEQRPWWGYGIGAFHPTNPYPGSYIQTKHPGSIEPVYLHLILQLGLIGFGVFILLLWSMWHSMGKAKDICASEYGRGILLISCVGGLCFPFFLGTNGLTIMIAAIAPLIWRPLSTQESQPAVAPNSED